MFHMSMFLSFYSFQLLSRQTFPDQSEAKGCSAKAMPLCCSMDCFIWLVSRRLQTRPRIVCDRTGSRFSIGKVSLLISFEMFVRQNI